MPSMATVLKDEIRRLARKEARADSAKTKQASAQHRRDIAALKRQVDDLTRRLAFLEKQEKRRVAKPRVSEEAAEKARFSPSWLKAHRERLGLSAADYGRLVGVSGLSIYNWEGGKTKPRQAQVAKLSAIRGLRKREAQRRLELLGGH